MSACIENRRLCTVWVHFACHLQGLWGCHVCVGSGHSQDDGIGVGDVLQDLLFNLNLDIFGLVPYRYLMLHKYTQPSIRADEFKPEEQRFIHPFTFVMPGRSTSVRFTTCGEKIFRWMGSSLIPFGEKQVNSCRRALQCRFLHEQNLGNHHNPRLRSYLISARDSFCFCFDFFPDLLKVCVDLKMQWQSFRL